MVKNTSMIEYIKIMLILFLINKTGLPSVLTFNLIITIAVMYFVNLYVMYKMDKNKIFKKDIVKKHLLVTTLFNIIMLLVLKYNPQFSATIAVSNIFMFIVLQQKYGYSEKMTQENIDNYFKNEKNR